MLEKQKSIFNFLDITKDERLKKSVIEGLSMGIPIEKISEYQSLMRYVIDNKSHLFDREEFKGSLFEDDDETLSLILPAVRRVYGKAVLNPPSIFKDKRLQLFILYFDINDFIDYLVDMLLKCHKTLINFEYLDRAAETLTLIVDNYIAKLVRKVRECEDIDIELRDAKIGKITWHKI